MSSEFDARSQWIHLGGDGIVYIKTKPGVEIDLADAEESVQKVALLCQGAARPTLVDLSDLKSITREARSYYAGPETAKVESAMALVIKSPLTKAIGNFFLSLHKPMIPTRLFRSEVEAVEWLRTFLT